MTHAPTVSVIIPCLDQAQFLGAAIRSIQRQTLSAVETIVVDDGSIDGTVDEALRCGATLIRQLHAGVSAARNRGLAAAAGTFVVFLDADDELEPDALESGVAVLQAHAEAWMVARCCTLTDASGLPLPTGCHAPDTDEPYPVWLQRNLVWTPGAAMFRRVPFAALGGFPLDVGPAADYAVYLRLARAERVVFDARPVVRYRQHASNMSRDYGRMLRATLEVLRREREHVPPRYAEHYERGVEEWRRFYGEEIIQQLRLDLRAKRVGLAQWRAAWLLVTECRALARTHLWRKLSRLVRGYPSSDVEPGRFTEIDRRAANGGLPESVEAPR